MRMPMMAGNWKMNKTPAEAVEFVNTIKGELQRFPQVERVVCPPYVALPGVRKALEGTDIGIGAQDVHWAASGAHTSSVAANMLLGLADYVIVGHSETRQNLGVSDEEVNKKARIALQHGLKPIIAIGETLEQNEAGATAAICDRQLRVALDGISEADMVEVVVAYEPVWAIGTGKTATPEQAQSIMGDVVRPVLVELYGPDVAATTRILYGGSMKPGNCADLMKQPDIDGGLIGGASLEVDDFVALVRVAVEVKILA